MNRARELEKYSIASRFGRMVRELSMQGMRSIKTVRLTGVFMVMVALSGICVQPPSQASEPLPSVNNPHGTEEQVPAVHDQDASWPKPDPFVPPVDMSDKAVSAWAAADVDWMVANRIVPQQLQFGYANYITREEFAGLAVSVLNFMSRGKADLIYTTLEHSFVDTQNPDVQKAYSYGIVNGVSDTEFKPEANISRQEAAMMMANLLQSIQAEHLSATDYAYADRLSIADWALDAVDITSNIKLFQGTDQGFRPQDNYTREQAITVMRRLLQFEGSAHVVALRGHVVVHIDELGTEEDAQANKARPLAAIVGPTSVKFTWTEAASTVANLLGLLQEEDSHVHSGVVSFSTALVDRLKAGAAPVQDGPYTLQTGAAVKPGEGFLLSIMWE